MVKIMQGDCLEILKTLSDESVNCCITSPPYWGLRDYGGCSCGTKRYKEETGQGEGTGGALNYRVKYEHDCKFCDGTGRVSGMGSQLGIERTPEEYVAKMVEVFREVRRVLRDDGTLFLNLGDSYSGSHGTTTINDDVWASDRRTFRTGSARFPDGLKPKDLVGIPWLVAFALRADGWYLRQDIIWSKPNPMPESVTDRCTKAHEYIFLMSKSQRYFYDAAAIKEKGAGRELFGNSRRLTHDDRNDCDRKDMTIPDNRNRRSVWTVTTAPFPGAHFATFPPKLIEPCILAGCPKGGTVLDPFGGSGTVGMVAEQNGRDSILIELNSKYVEMAKRRTAQRGLFCSK